MRRFLDLLIVLPLLTASACSEDETPDPPSATTKQLTDFGFQAVDNAALAVDVIATIDGTSIAAVVPAGTDVTSLVARFSTTGTSVRVGATNQVSGVTANDYTSPVTYTVVAEDGSTQDYTVSVSDASSAKELTGFSFLAADNSALAVDVIAAIDGTNITATVEPGTDVTALVATFITTGASVRVGATPQESGVTSNDFTSPVTYTVVAADDSTRDYTVTVSPGVSAGKELTSFAFRASHNSALDVDVNGVITAAQIAVQVPAGTDVTALVATFTTTGTSVRVASTTQVNNVTANDFTSPVVYTVVAEDTSTQDYTVTVTEAASTVWFGDYTIRDADDMATISGYTEITGYLRITSDLTDLDGLDSLATVGAHLDLDYNPALTDVSGLGALTTVGTFVSIMNNDALTHIDGLGITSIGTHLEVIGNDLLEDVGGLSTLTTVGTTVEINNNAALESIAGLASLTSIPESLIVERNPSLSSLVGLEQVTALGIGAYDIGLEISDNDALLDLTGLDNLTAVAGAIGISGNAQLASLAGLDDLASVGEQIAITGNPLLTTLSHLSSLTTVPSLVIGTNFSGGNASLDTIDIPTLESVGILFVEANAGLDDLTGLTALHTIGELQVTANPTLTTLGFGGTAATPTVVTDSIEIFRNDAIEDLDGLDATTTLSGYVRIIDNPALTSLAALDGVTAIGSYLQIGSVDFGGHPNLPAIGFPALATIGGELRIEENDHASLTSLTFGDLQSVGGSVFIQDNDSLVDIAGLANLSEIPGNLEIVDNVDLTDISALAGLTTITGSLVIDGNVSIDTLLGLDDLSSVGFTLRIANNNELDHLDNLDGLTSLAGALELERNYNLLDVDGLAGLTAVGGHIFINTNSLLANTDGLANIETIDGYVWVTYNGLTSLDLSSLQAVLGDLRIQNNTLLTAITLTDLVSVQRDLMLDNITSLSTIDLSALTTINRNIYVRNVGGLTSLAFLATVASSGALGGDLTLENDTSLSDISALAGITTIGGNLDITNNDALGSLDAFGDVTSIGGSVWVRQNAIVGDLGGLAAISSIDGLLMVDNNGSLTTLGLDALESLTYDLYVRDNGSLCADRATELQTQLEGHGWTRTAYLSGNTGACP